MNHWDRLKDVVASALELSPAEQGAYLNRVCSGDPDLLAEAQRLLEFGSGLQNFLSVPDAGGTPNRSPLPTFLTGDLVADRYEIVEWIGSGGMGDVYRARDIRLDGQEVALKAIRAEYAGDSRLERLLTREVMLAREVVHPNVCPVYDVGETGTGPSRVCFLSMKLLDGESLGQRLQRGPMTPGELLPLARQIAEGLTAAHAAGIIHRDLKPGNVMLCGGRAVITDFGLARSSAHGDATSVNVGGTLGYMSPEQMAGERVNARSDIYAFGALLYKALTNDSPRPAIGIDPELTMPLVPPAWQRAIRKAMHPDPARRFAAARDVIAAIEEPRWSSPLRRRTAVLVACVATASAALLLVPQLRHRLQHLFSSLPADRHVAILPVAVSSTDPLDSAVTAGLLESLSSDLGRAEQTEDRYWVAPAADVVAKSIGSAADAAKHLGANLALTARWTRDDSGVRVHLRLLPAPAGNALREQTILVPPGKLAELPGKLLGTAARMLDVDVPAAEPAAPISPRAFQLYESALLRIRRHDLPEIEKAIVELHQVTELEPRFAQGFARLGVAHAIRYYHTRQAEAIELARRHVERAIELDSKSSSAYLSAAIVDINIGDHANAVRRLQRALALDPDNSDALVQLARSYSRLGRQEEAEKAYLRGVELRPNSWTAYNLLGTFYLGRANYAAAEKNFRYVVQSAPGNVIGLNNLAATQLALGRYREAADLLQKSVAIQPSAQAYSNLGNAYFLEGRYAEAAAAMQKAVELTPKNHGRWRNLGDCYLMLDGRRADAMAAFRQAADLAREELKLNAGNQALKVSLALYLAKLSEKQEALSLLRSVKIADADLGGVFREAMAYELAGDRAAALERLAVAIDRGFSQDQIQKARELEDLRKDPRFSRLLNQRR